MCQKKLLRYRNSTCCLGFQPISYCQARMHGFHCMDPRIVGVKATNVDKPTSHADVECNATLFCRMRVSSERVRFCKGDWDLVLPGLVVEPAGEVYKEVKKPVGVLRMPSCWRGAGGESFVLFSSFLLLFFLPSSLCGLFAFACLDRGGY